MQENFLIAQIQEDSQERRIHLKQWLERVYTCILTVVLNFLSNSFPSMINPANLFDLSDSSDFRDSSNTAFKSPLPSYLIENLTQYESKNLWHGSRNHGCHAAVDFKRNQLSCQVDYQTTSESHVEL